MSSLSGRADSVVTRVMETRLAAPPSHTGYPPSGALVLNDRASRERLEATTLAPAATLAAASAGRAAPEPPDRLRTAFQRDRDRILHSNALRRLARKTQVFIDPENDHFVTRLTHTLQVVQVGRSMAVALGLNEALTEAICLGHDIGHSPFGHTGEDALAGLVDGGWEHSIHSVRVLSVCEPLNLSLETLDGIRAHPWRIDPPPSTPEGQLCRYADRIAYLGHDVLDAIRAGLIGYSDLPSRVRSELGRRHRQWVATMVHGVVDESVASGAVTMAPDVAEAMAELRRFMFDRVYLSDEAKQHREYAARVVRELVVYFDAHPSEVPDSATVGGISRFERAVDYVAGMTDRLALRLHGDLCA